MRSVGLLCLAWVCFVAGCVLPTTQLLVVVDSDYGPTELTQIEVRTYGLEEYLSQASPSPIEQRIVEVRAGSAAAVEIPFSFGVVPLGGRVERRVVIQLTARPTTGADTVVVRAITGFVPRETRRLPMFIARSCAGVMCEADETCDRAGMCVPAEVQPGPVVRPGEELEDTGVRVDAGMDAFIGFDAYVPPGVDAPFPDAWRPEPPDAFSPDAFVPPGIDAPFPDAWSPDAFVEPDAWSADAFVPIGVDAPFPPDAFDPLDAFEPPDAYRDADAWAPDAWEPPTVDSGATCGALGQSCCDAGARCDIGLTCTGIACVVPSECGLGQPCCPGNCCAGGLVCAESGGTSTCFLPTPCGMDGQVCCEGQCQVGLLCTNGWCRRRTSSGCGSLLEDCCPLGMPACSMGLTCDRYRGVCDLLGAPSCVM